MDMLRVIAQAFLSKFSLSVGNNIIYSSPSQLTEYPFEIFFINLELVVERHEYFSGEVGIYENDCLRG